MIREDCKYKHNLCEILSKSGSCSLICNCYEQDQQIARDNDTAEIATKSQKDYKELYERSCLVLIDHHETINKLKYDNKLMSSFIAKSGLVFNG